MTKYVSRKNTSRIYEAMEFNGENFAECNKFNDSMSHFISFAKMIASRGRGDRLSFICTVNDWIVKSPEGDFRVYDSKEFSEKYILYRNHLHNELVESCPFTYCKTRGCSGHCGRAIVDIESFNEQDNDNHHHPLLPVACQKDYCVTKNLVSIFFAEKNRHFAYTTFDNVIHNTFEDAKFHAAGSINESVVRWRKTNNGVYGVLIRDEGGHKCFVNVYDYRTTEHYVKSDFVASSKCDRPDKCQMGKHGCMLCGLPNKENVRASGIPKRCESPDKCDFNSMGFCTKCARDIRTTTYLYTGTKPALYFAGCDPYKKHDKGERSKTAYFNWLGYIPFPEGCDNKFGHMAYTKGDLRWNDSNDSVVFVPNPDGRFCYEEFKNIPTSLTEERAAWDDLLDSDFLSSLVTKKILNDITSDACRVLDTDFAHFDLPTSPRFTELINEFYGGKRILHDPELGVLPLPSDYIDINRMVDYLKKFLSKPVYNKGDFIYLYACGVWHPCLYEHYTKECYSHVGKSTITGKLVGSPYEPAMFTSEVAIRVETQEEEKVNNKTENLIDEVAVLYEKYNSLITEIEEHLSKDKKHDDPGTMTKFIDGKSVEYASRTFFESSMVANLWERIKILFGKRIFFSVSIYNKNVAGVLASEFSARVEPAFKEKMSNDERVYTDGCSNKNINCE